MMLNKEYNVTLCEDQDKFWVFFSIPQMINYMASLAIVAQSYIIRYIFVWLMRFTYFKTDSARVRFMTVSIFMIFFFNYGIMFLLAPFEIDILGL